MARIVIVDDAVFMRTVLRNILEEAGHEVVAEAATGENAVAAYEEHRPDLVTMDLVMPGEGGLPALRRILQLDPGARVIVVSAVGQQRDVEAAIEAGATDFLVKPFEKETVIETVQRIAAETVRQG